MVDVWVASLDDGYEGVTSLHHYWVGGRRRHRRHGQGVAGVVVENGCVEDPDDNGGDDSENGANCRYIRGPRHLPGQATQDGGDDAVRVYKVKDAVLVAVEETVHHGTRQA